MSSTVHSGIIFGSLVVEENVRIVSGKSREGRSP